MVVVGGGAIVGCCWLLLLLVVVCARLLLLVVLSLVGVGVVDDVAAAIASHLCTGLSTPQN